ncbi:MAG: hypothetical protein AAB553_01165 [Patescibacteria group bacterium]
MYYSYPCSYCSFVFYTYDDSRFKAAERLAKAIKQHLIETGEDDKETKFDYGEKWSGQMVEKEMTESPDAPPGGVQV